MSRPRQDADYFIESDLLKAGEIAERVAPQAEQGSPLRPASDLRREHGNPVGKSASVEKVRQPGDSGENGKAFVSEPVAASRENSLAAQKTAATNVSQIIQPTIHVRARVMGSEREVEIACVLVDLDQVAGFIVN